MRRPGIELRPSALLRLPALAHALLPALSAVPLLAACARPGRSATPERPNVLLVAVDTLRADRIGAYGGNPDLCPRIDRLAREGVLFAHAFSHAPWTLPAFASLMTSLPPPAHGAGGQVDDFHGLPPGIPTLAERFQAEGYATGAIVNVDFLARPFGVTRGFAHLDVRAYEDNDNLRPAGATTDAALAYLREHRDGAFFLMVHYFDPHAEYRPPPAFRRRFAAPEDREDDRFRFGTRRQVVERRSGRLELRAPDIERAEKLYDGEAAYVDEQVGRLLDALAELSLATRTLVVFTADHGEEFLDHGDWEHGHTLYDELLRSPLLVRQEGRLLPRRVEAAVGHVDVAPTILALCGLEACATFQGRDLSSAIRGENLPPARLLAFGNFWGPPLASLREGEYQLILAPDGRRQLYRWTSDPEERLDLAAGEVHLADELQAKLERARIDAAAAGRGPGPRVRLSSEEIRRLSAVGYSGGD